MKYVLLALEVVAILGVLAAAAVLSPVWIAWLVVQSRKEMCRPNV